MILKFTTTDILNTTLVDARTGFLAYNIVTHVLDEEGQRTHLHASGSADAVPTLRKTWIYDSGGRAVGEIGWSGRIPKDIVVAEENIGGLTHLFGSSTVRFLPKVLSIPTRFDGEYVWTATNDSLILLDYESEKAKGQFHFNSVRIGSRVFKTHVPGIGSNYLEFQPHPLAHPAEVIISFLMVEIVRRGRFSLQRYSFDCPNVRRLHDAYDSVIRKMKTVQLDHEMLSSPVLSLLSLLPRMSSPHTPSR